MCEPHDSTGEPGAGNRHAGFGERGEETCPWDADCGPVRKRRQSHRLPTGYAPPLDSTGVALFVALVVLFCIGHVFLAVGFCIRKCWKKVFCNRKHVSEYKDAVSRIKNLNCGQAWLVEERDVHLGAEISVFIGKPDLHARFVERYNTLWHLRLGLAASLLCAGVIGPAVGFWWGNCHMLNICVGVVAFLSGVVLMRQHLVTNTSFLNRVTAAYEIVQQEAQKPDTRQS